MPAIIAHKLFSERVLREIFTDSSAPAIHENAFWWGAQGPDFFYYHGRSHIRRGEKMAKYGSMFHQTHPCAIFDAMRTFLRQNAGPSYNAALSYCLGFVCHYALDRRIHPLVLAEITEQKIMHDAQRQKRPFNDSVMHFTIESMLDVLILRRETQLLPIEYKLQSALPGDKELAGLITSLYSFLLRTVFDVSGLEEKITQSQWDMQSGARLLNDRTTYKRSFFKVMEKMLRTGPVVSSHILPLLEGDDYDYGNLSNSVWRGNDNPDLERTESFFELFDQAADEAGTLIHQFLDAVADGGSFCAITQCLSFNDGAVQQRIVIL